MDVNDLVKNMSDAFATTASVKSVYGDAITVGARTVIPVAEVRYGFGAGGGGRNNQNEGGSGGGGRVTARATGALEITPEGTRFITLDDRPKLTRALAIGFVLGVAVVSMMGRRQSS